MEKASKHKENHVHKCDQLMGLKLKERRKKCTREKMTCKKLIKKRKVGRERESREYKRWDPCESKTGAR